MKTVLIRFEEYCEETNDVNEIRDCKRDGPRYRDEEGFFRIPRSGFVRNGVEYQLRGFGKLDKKPGPKIDIPEEARDYLSRRMGHAYVPHFIRDRDLRVKVSTAVSLIGWSAVQAAIESAARTMPITKAVHYAVSLAKPALQEDPYDLPPAGQIGEDLEDLLK